MNETTEKRVLELAGLLCEEAITEAQFGELDTILKSDSEARELYRSFLGMHHHLGNGILENSVKVAETRFPRRRTIGIATAAAAAIITFGLFLAKIVTHQAEPVPDFILTRAIDIEWDHAHRFQAKLGEPITEKHLRIKSGIAQVQFSSGAIVTIEGPAKFRLDDPMRCFSHYGKLTANCPRSAQGFTIRFPGGKVVDVGTEFALDTEQEGKTEVHVLQGEVIVTSTDSNERIISKKSLLERDSIALGRDQEIHHIDYNDEPFAAITKDSLIQTQPIKLQLDLGHRAGLYHGANAPAHTTGDIHNHETTWTQIVGDQFGTFAMADGNLCPHPIKVDYGHGNG